MNWEFPKGFAMLVPWADSNIFAYNGFARATDNFTKVLNTHAVKVGGIVERQYKQQNFQHQNNVQLVFAPWGNGSTGNEFADLMVGRPAQAVVGQPSAVGHFVAWNYEFFVQDSWKATKNFTLEYGLRIGKWTNNIETNGLGAIFDPRSVAIYGISERTSLRIAENMTATK